CDKGLGVAQGHWPLRGQRLRHGVASLFTHDSGIIETVGKTAYLLPRRPTTLHDFRLASKIFADHLVDPEQVHLFAGEAEQPKRLPDARIPPCNSDPLSEDGGRGGNRQAGGRIDYSDLGSVWYRHVVHEDRDGEPYATPNYYHFRVRDLELARCHP